MDIRTKVDSVGPSTSRDTYMCHHHQREVINIMFTLTSTHTTLNIHLSTHVPLEMGCVYLCQLRRENLPVIPPSRPNCVPVFTTTSNTHITPKTGYGWTCHRNSGSSQSHGFLSTHSTTAGVNVHTKPRTDEQWTYVFVWSLGFQVVSRASLISV